MENVFVESERRESGRFLFIRSNDSGPILRWLCTDFLCGNQSLFWEKIPGRKFSSGVAHSHRLWHTDQVIKQGMIDIPYKIISRPTF